SSFCGESRFSTVYEQGELASNRDLRSRRGSRQRHHFRGGGGLFILSCRRIVRRGLVPSDAFRVWFTACRKLGAGRERHWFQVRHAFWLLSDDRSARSHGAGSSLRALSTGDVSLTPFRVLLEAEPGPRLLF